MSSPTPNPPREEDRQPADEPTPDELRDLAELVREGGFELLAGELDSLADEKEEQ